jgi:hypothetical protein
MEKEHPLELEKIHEEEDDESDKFVKINSEVDEITGVQKTGKKEKVKKDNKHK